MKAITYKAGILVVMILIIVSGCQKSNIEEESDEVVFMGKISGDWKIKNAAVDGKDVSFSFPSMKLSVTSDRTYTVANAVSPIWSGSGTFIVEGASPNFSLKRDDGVLITVSEINTSSLTLKFQFTGSKNGRVDSISGKYEFTFER